jgi:hypothetical protein
MTESMPATCDCKLGRNAREYGLDTLDTDLLARREEGESLRSLARYVNVRLLNARLLSADVDVVGDAESVYEVLEGEDIAPERRADVQDRLTYAGIDIDSLRKDYVSHQTVRAHLNDCLDVDTSRQGISSVAEARELVEWASDKEERTITQTLVQLVQNGTLTFGDLDVTVSVTIRCAKCGDSFRLPEVFEKQECSCGGRC